MEQFNMEQWFLDMIPEIIVQNLDEKDAASDFSMEVEGQNKKQSLAHEV